jgi:rubrerythrin
MTDEQEKTLEALQTALEMEIDGKECYLQASKESKNEVGSKLLASLAKEEDNHRRRFAEIYEAMRKKKDWPIVRLEPERVKKLRQLFNQTCELVGVNVSGNSTELDAIKTSIDKEKKSYDFYGRQSQSAKYETERDFFKNLAAEEKEHELILLDYYEYLSNPAAWFLKSEHHSLDGG